MSGWHRWAVGTAELDCIAMAVMPECPVVVVTKEHWVVDGSLVEWVEGMRLAPVGMTHWSRIHLSLIRLIRSRHSAWPL